MFEKHQAPENLEMLEKEMHEARKDASRKVTSQADFGIENRKKGVWQRIRNVPKEIAGEVNAISAMGKLDRLEERTREARGKTPEFLKLKDNVRIKELELEMAQKELDDYINKGTLTHLE